MPMLASAHSTIESPWSWPAPEVGGQKSEVRGRRRRSEDTRQRGAWATPRFNGPGMHVDFGIPCWSVVTSSYGIRLYNDEHGMPSFFEFGIPWRDG